MTLFKIAGRLIWLGHHRSMGPVIYEEAHQRSEGDRGRVWLYVVSSAAFELFHKDTVRKLLVTNHACDGLRIAEEYAARPISPPEPSSSEPPQHYEYADESRFIDEMDYIVQSEFTTRSSTSEISDDPRPAHGSAPDHYETFLYKSIDGE